MSSSDPIRHLQDEIDALGGLVTQDVRATASPTFVRETLTATTTQIALGTGNRTTLSAPTPASAQTVLIPDYTALISAPRSLVATDSTNPILTRVSNAATMLSGPAGSAFTCSTAVINTLAMGDIVVMQGCFIWTANPGGGNQVTIPLPFTVSNTVTGARALASVVKCTNVGFTAGDPPGLYAAAGSANLQLFRNITAASPTAVLATDLGATGELHFFGIIPVLPA